MRLTQFSADEVFETALQIERNGRAFYEKAAGCVADDKVRRMLGELAQMERAHEATFAMMRTELEGKEAVPAAFDPDNANVLYLHAMADHRVFDAARDACDVMSSGDDPEELLHKAIGFERDSIAFYTGLADVVPDKLGKDRVEEIIRQERMHELTLYQALDELARPNTVGI